MSSRARNEIRNTIQPVFGASFDAEELCRHVKGADDCEGLLDDSPDEAQTANGLAKNIARIGNGFLVLEAVIHKKDALAVQRTQMTKGASQVVFSS